MTDPKNTHPESQKKRWLTYAPLMAIMLIATLFVVFAVNWIAYDKFRTLRLDLTLTRQYSLSEQTTNVLTNLPTDITITALYARGSAPPQLLQKIDDILDEYKRRSPRINTQRIDPTFDIQKFETFNADILTRFDSDIQTAKQHINTALQSLDTLQTFSQTKVPQLTNSLQSVSTLDARAIALLKLLGNNFTLLPDELTTAKTQTDKFLNQSLPNFTDAKNTILSSLNNLNTTTLTPAIAQLNTLVDFPSTPAPSRDLFLGLINDFQQLTDQIQPIIYNLQDLDTSAYDTVRRSIMANNSLILSVPLDSALDPTTQGLVTLNLTDIFPNLLRAQLDPQSGSIEQGFKGEEVITSAILQLTLAHNTRVVFINPHPFSLITPNPRVSPEHLYTQIASRLGKMNFIVDEWRPAGQTTATGQPLPPQPRPIPEDGQTLIFISPPPPPPNPQAPNIGPTTDPAAAASGAVITHITEGRPALLLFDPPLATMGFGAPDPRLDTLAPFGLTIDTSQLVVTTQPASQGQTETTNQIHLTQWPEDHPISTAIRGLRGVLLQAMAINITPTDGVQTWPLAQTPPEAWASPNALAAMGQGGPQALAPIKPSDDATQGPFTVAVAAQKNNNRIVAIADPAWATDYVTNYGPRGPFGQPLYRTVPANAELVVNSVCWLANLDMLIAPGASTQDIRRIGPVSRSAAMAVTWATLLGLPLACLLAGLAVWFTRRN